MALMNRVIPFPHKKYGMYYVEEDFRDAAYRGDVKHMQDILDRYPKFNINASNEYGETALYIACKRNQEDAVSFLLKKPGVDPNSGTILGNRSLLIAAWNDNNKIAQKLLDNGADISARTNPDRKYHANVSALDIAIERENHELQKILQKGLGNDVAEKPQGLQPR